jgi:hypothetical protein
MDSKTLLKFGTPLLTFGLLELAQFVKLTAIFGMSSDSISGFSALGPVAGAFTGTGLFAGFLVLHRLFKMAFTGCSFMLTMYIPTICAAYYWENSSKLIRLFLPVACLLLFVMHPVGSKAFVYALYWFIPISLYFLPRQSVLFVALGSTFIQHAVGSVIWLYFYPMAAEQWYALIPVVAVERLLFALCMTASYYALRASLRLLVSYRASSLQPAV